MRFPKETRALIHEAGSNAVTIPWPMGQEPKKGRVYWLQSEEDAEEAERKAKARREHSPDTCAEVLAGMRRRHYGEPEPKASKGKRRRQPINRPEAGDPRILVIDTSILEQGWEAKVALYEDPDPVKHLRVKAKVPAGPNPLTGRHEKAETEPERIDPIPTHQRRREEEEALIREHKASVDASEVIRAENHVANLRKRGKRSQLAEEAAKRARRRAEDAAELVSAGAPV